jgi:hypothetical protein
MEGELTIVQASVISARFFTLGKKLPSSSPGDIPNANADDSGGAFVFLWKAKSSNVRLAFIFVRQ